MLVRVLTYWAACRQFIGLIARQRAPSKCTTLHSNTVHSHSRHCKLCNLQPDCIHSIDCAELPDCRVLQYFLRHCSRLFEIHFTCTDCIAMVASQCSLLLRYNSFKELLIGNWQVSKHTADPSKTLVTMICSSKHQARPLFC